MNTSPDQMKTDQVAPSVAPSQTPSVTVDPLVIRTSQNVIPPPAFTQPPENPQPPVSPIVPSVSTVNSTTASSVMSSPITPPTAPPLFTQQYEKPPEMSDKFPSSLPAVPDSSAINSTLAPPPVKPPATPPPFSLHSDKPPNKFLKFPIIVAGLLIIVSVLGFGGSVIYFGFINKPTKKIASNSLTINPPPLNIPSPTIQPPANIFITPSISFRNLFSSDVYASDNPFDDTANPFTGVSGSSQNTDAYQNPFEGQP